MAEFPGKAGSCALCPARGKGRFKASKHGGLIRHVASVHGKIEEFMSNPDIVRAKREEESQEGCGQVKDEPNDSSSSSPVKDDGYSLIKEDIKVEDETLDESELANGSYEQTEEEVTNQENGHAPTPIKEEIEVSVDLKQEDGGGAATLVSSSLEESAVTIEEQQPESPSKKRARRSHKEEVIKEEVLDAEEASECPRKRSRGSAVKIELEETPSPSRRRVRPKKSF